jgi:putative PIN family toxin of toxin-antitoxin system
MLVVIDTNVFVGACLGAGAANQVVAACLTGRLQPLIGAALMNEYEDVLGRAALFRRSRLDERERSELLDIFLARCQWIRIYFGWRPNLRDEGDNHLIELAVAGGAAAIVTRNTRDLLANQLKFPDLRIVTPEALLREETP